MGDGRNWDHVKIAPASNHQEADNFGDARMGAAPMKVSMTDSSLLPSCNDILASIHQMDTRTSTHLLDRMDQFSNGDLKSKGVTFNELDQMMKSPQFSTADKQAIGVMQKLFSHAAGREGDPQHMTMRELALTMIETGVRENCQVPGQNNNNNPGPPRRKM